MAEYQPLPDPQPLPTDMLPWEDKRHFRRIFRDQASRSYLFLCLGMGILALLLPIVLLVIDGDGGHPSISHYYYSDPALGRDVLVGTLCAVGVFLFLFRGLSTAENWLLNIAGASAIAVALSPTSSNPCAGSAVSLHGSAAGLFFLCLAIVAVFYSKRRLATIVYPPLKQRLSLAYNACGIAMVVLPGAVFLMHLMAANACERPLIFWAESLGIWSFSAYWFVKAYEYRKLLGIR